MSNPYETDLDRNAANFAPLTPLGYIERSASVFPRRIAVIHGARRYTWSETYARCRRLASALAARGIGVGDTVSVMLSNTPAMYECHFGVPMCGAVLHSINTRLDAGNVAFMLDHAQAKVVIIDREFSPVMKQALAQASVKPLLVDLDDPEYRGPGERLADSEYEEFIAQGDPAYAWKPPADEWNAIALNYTSGTTGNPKGVVYHHRGAALNAVNNILAWAMPHHAVYLWTLPMFHCNGWCFPWTMAANAGTNVCLRRVDAKLIFDAIREHKVTHYCGAPIVHSTLINADPALRQGITHKVSAFVAGAAPPAAMIEGMERMGWDLTHVYDLTETYGPAASTAKHDEWQALDIAGRAERNGRQGVRYLLEDGMTVMDPQTMTPVPADGETMGEIMFRGNITMKGYLRNAKATAEAFAGGWFHSGDLAVMQPDGAVVAKPDPKWGETPLAFVELKPGATATEEEMIEHCRTLLARFKCPREVRFAEVPKTSTGKIQKFQLRALAKSASAIE
jgi:fatty-acyl-CoA synthase